MRLNDGVRKFYQNNYNCAEAVFLGATGAYALQLEASLSKLVGGFGGGIQTGSTCGAFLAAVSVISYLMIEDRAHETPSLKQTVACFTERMEQKLGSTRCGELRPRYFRPDVRCQHTVDVICEELEAVLVDLGYDTGRGGPYVRREQ